MYFVYFVVKKYKPQRNTKDCTKEHEGNIFVILCDVLRVLRGKKVQTTKDCTKENEGKD